MDELWERLTKSDTKRHLYVRETYFREGLAEAQKLLGGGFVHAMQRVALLMIKPDGLASGKASAIIEFLREHQYSITAVELVSLGRLHWRELWRFQLTSATLDRLAVNALVLERPALLLLLRDESSNRLPATVRLSLLKGPSGVASQPPDCLRRRIGQPNRIFSFAHVSDEPADLLRELAILLDGSKLRRVLASHTIERLAQSDQEALDSALSAPIQNSLKASEAIQHALKAVQRTSPTSPALDRVRGDLNFPHDHCL